MDILDTPQKISGYLFFVTGFFLVMYAFFQKRKVKQSRYWLSTEAEIIQSEVYKSTQAQIRYKYSVKNQAYEGNTICLGGTLNRFFKKRAMKRCQNYPVGSVVLIYYKPTNPKKSCLERKGEMISWSYIIGLIFCLMGGLIINGLIFQG